MAVDEELKLFRRGKVRDTYEVGDGTLVMVASDRVSAFDVVLPTSIPHKGQTLAQMSKWWFEKTASVCPNHLLDNEQQTVPIDLSKCQGRALRVAKAKRVDIECVVRDYIAGSGWKEYIAQGTLAEEPLPLGLLQSDRLPEPRFTPAIKNDVGHDENISRARLADIVGTELAQKLEQLSLTLFAAASPMCKAQGFLLVDTKFEFGFIDGKLSVIDEIFTPDSSRFWLQSSWRPGQPVEAFDKQPIRDYLEQIGWNKNPPAPDLPSEIVQDTTARYLEIANRLCGINLS